MQITCIKIQNFKSIQDLTLQLKPLTILVGPNASGKSSIVQALAWASIRTKHNPMLTNDVSSQEARYFNIESYHDLALNRSLNGKWMGVELTFTIPKVLKRDRLSPIINEINWQVLRLRKPDLKNFTYGFKISRTNGGRGFELTMSVDNLNFTLICWHHHPSVGSFWQLKGSLRAKGATALSYSMFSPLHIHSRVLDYKGELSEDEADSLKTLDLLLEQLLNIAKPLLKDKFFWLGPDRGTKIPLEATPKRTQQIASSGQNLLEALAHAYLHYDRKVKEELSSFIAKWAEQLGVKDLNIGLTEEATLRATYHDLKASLELAMASHGHKQILTMLTQLIIAPLGSLIAIEEPEISLHPQAQAYLPLLFADVIKKHNKQLLITTHSSILVLALSDAVMGSEEHPEIPRLSVNDIALYYVYRNKEGLTQAKLIPLTEEGYPEGGIPSFTEVEVKLYQKMLQRLSK